MLKETSDAFNEIFGWTILLNIFFGALRALIYLDVAIKGNENFESSSAVGNTFQIISHASVIILFWVSSVVRVG